MIELERARKEMELKRVEMARLEMELQVREREADIHRLQQHIEIQKTKELELRQLLKGE